LTIIRSCSLADNIQRDSSLFTLHIQSDEEGQKHGRARLRWVGVVAFFAWIIAVPAAHAQYFSLGKGPYPLEFYDIDFTYLADPAKQTGILDTLHYIPVGFGSESYLSLGGELREQYWNQVNESHGLRSPTQNSYDLQRAVADAYLHFDPHLAVFVQLDRSDAFDKIAPSTTDETRGRVQQGFMEIKEPLGPADITARVGRQEITLGSGRFVWINDSSNVRTTHDGARVHADLEDGATLDLIATRPVTPTYNAFDDWYSHSGSFGAAYASEPLIPGQLHLDEYYFYRRNPGAQYASLTGNEDRSTFGGRVWGATGGFKFDSDFAYQYGTFDTTTKSKTQWKTISAFGTSTRVLYGFDEVPLQPAVQFQTSYFSGSDDPKSKTIGTFSAPFPRPTLLNYAGLETLENLFEAYPSVLINPTSELVLRFGPQALWRANVNDAVYISRTTPLTKTLNDSARYVGTNLTSTAQWRIAQNVTVFGEYVREIAGRAITLAGGHGADVGVVQIDFNF
jgi:hypothetical protein